MLQLIVNGGGWAFVPHSFGAASQACTLRSLRGFHAFVFAPVTVAVASRRSWNFSLKPWRDCLTELRIPNEHKSMRQSWNIATLISFNSVTLSQERVSNGQQQRSR
jgi:hypothetical protein